MTKAEPHVHCVDFWPSGIPAECLAAYKALIDAGQITKRKAVLSENFGSVAVEYDSTIPKEWIRQELHRIALEEAKEKAGTRQLSLYETSA